ncbi:MAG: ABC transporter ATP-binding protein [Anaerolineae bacterium]|nr:ABC transporter ATP-binding protein [Anaerolineae bacterium]
MTLALECAGVRKSFTDCTALRGADLRAEAGQIVALLGPSGCGKTTLLRLIAGFDRPDGGEIRIGGRLVAGNGAFVPPEQRRVGMVFQDYALFPHLPVAANVSFGLRGPALARTARADALLEQVGLAGLAARMPGELSGGQQQRVALARALAPEPQIILLDEPFSNLDAALRQQVRGEVRDILRRSGATCVFVTHDQEEALSLADVVAVMLDGRVVQADAPETLYARPASPQVAAFVGEANFIYAELCAGEALTALGALPLASYAGPEHSETMALVRPEAIRLDADAEGNARVLWREYYGHSQRVGLLLDTGEMLVARPGSAQRYDVGQRVAVRVEGPVIAYPAEMAEMVGA